MREEYDIKSLNPRKNPYAKDLKKPITINLDESVVEYFKRESDSVGVPYQTLINMYLRDCVTNERHIDMTWKSRREATH
jgi:uncharacterized protein (DUF4415 family)